MKKVQLTVHTMAGNSHSGTPEEYTEKEYQTLIQTAKTNHAGAHSWYLSGINGSLMIFPISAVEAITITVLSSSEDNMLKES